jgi:hypothetical protein
MSKYKQVFEPNDLALFVWPRQSEIELRAGGGRSRKDAASSAWAMDRTKADRVRVVISVYDGIIVGAWSVNASTSTLEAPEGKTRRVNRASFDTYEDPRLAFLVGQPSQLGPRRNPQTTIELRDLVGAEVLVDAIDDEPRHGVARVGEFTLTVHEDGTADLNYPATAALTLRPLV